MHWNCFICQNSVYSTCNSGNHRFVTSIFPGSIGVNGLGGTLVDEEKKYWVQWERVKRKGDGVNGIEDLTISAQCWGMVLRGNSDVVSQSTSSVQKLYIYCWQEIIPPNSECIDLHLGAETKLPTFGSGTWSRPVRCQDSARIQDIWVYTLSSRGQP